MDRRGPGEGDGANNWLPRLSPCAYMRESRPNKS